MSTYTGLIYVINITDRNCVIVLSRQQKMLYIGHGKQRQPEWFEDNIQTLTPFN